MDMAGKYINFTYLLYSKKYSLKLTTRLYLATILLVAMTLGLVNCAALLWKRHRETGDYSRIILSVVCGFAVLSALISLFRMWSMDSSGGFQYLDPGRIFYPVFFQL